VTGLDARVVAVLSRSAMIPESVFGRDKKLTDLGIGSLEQIECVLGLEDEFRVELPDAQVRKLKTVQDLIDLVETAVATRGSRADP
jgi:acyl carrier protein